MISVRDRPLLWVFISATRVGMGAAEPGRGPKSRNSGGTMGLEDTDFFFEFRPPNGKNNLTGFSGK